MYIYHNFIMNGILILLAFVLYNNYSKIAQLYKYRLFILILLFAIATNVHGLSHLALDRVYGFNPILLL